MKCESLQSQDGVVWLHYHVTDLILKERERGGGGGEEGGEREREEGRE